MKEVRENAKKLMEGFCRVCPVCNGKACVGEVPGMGGVGTGASFKANIKALSSLRFNMKLGRVYEKSNSLFYRQGEHGS